MNKKGLGHHNHTCALWAKSSGWLRGLNGLHAKLLLDRDEGSSLGYLGDPCRKLYRLSKCETIGLSLMCSS